MRGGETVFVAGVAERAGAIEIDEGGERGNGQSGKVDALVCKLKLLKLRGIKFETKSGPTNLCILSARK